MNKIPILKSILVSVLFALSIHSYAAWIDFEPQTITQPDGTVIHCFATGDEFYNWLHDENGFTIIQNHRDGFYYFAVLENDQLVPSTYKAGSIDPSSFAINPWTNISPEKMSAFRTDFLQNKMPEKPQVPGYNSPKSIKNEGILNNLVVYIRFSDQTEYTKDTMQYYNIFNNTNAGFNSMQNYFETVSYDLISIPSWFYPISSTETVISYQDIYPRNYFMPYDPVTNPNGYQSGQSGQREHALLKRACEFIEDEVPASLIIDKDSDGYVDNMVFIVRGATTAWATLLWPHRWALYGENVYINGKRVWDYNLQVEDHLNGQGAGVLCHEMFHSLSAPDLYHYNSAPYTSVGSWDLMDAAGNPPSSMGAYMKFRYGGWIDNIPEITECGTYTLDPLSEEENNCFKVASPNSNTDFYVVEYRVKTGTFENTIPGSGLLVYRINSLEDGNGNAQGPPDEVYLYRPGGSNSTNGNLGLANFAADFNRIEINDNTDPDPFLTNGLPGGLDISNVGFIGETISFDVNFEKEPVAEFESSENLITEGCAVNFTDRSLCEVNTWYWTFEGGTPGSSTDQHPQGIVYENAGMYDVTLIVTNGFGDNTIIKSDFIEVSTSAIPEVIFYASESAVCTGTSVVFTDYSKICPETWNWAITPSTFAFINGTNASSQHPEIQFNDSDSYTISLTVTNANGNATLSKDNYIFAGGTPFPFYEDFESGDMDQSCWTIVNPDNDNITWAMFSVAGNGGNYAAGINLYNYYQVFKRDQLISPPFDLSETNSAMLTFEHAYSLYQNPNYSDSLIVKISTDCGTNWHRILEVADNGNGSFATHEPFNFSFVPAVANDWCGSGFGSTCNEIDISAWTGTPDVQIMFETFRIAGNNLYIDNVSVDVQTNQNEIVLEDSHLFKIYPNPSSGIFTVLLNKNFWAAKILLYNAQGRLIMEDEFSRSSTLINLTDKPKGLYFIHVISDDVQDVKKIILE